MGFPRKKEIEGTVANGKRCFKTQEYCMVVKRRCKAERYAGMTPWEPLWTVLLNWVLSSVWHGTGLITFLF